MPQQFSVPALLKARLGNTLVIEETDDVGKEVPLGICLLYTSDAADE